MLSSCLDGRDMPGMLCQRFLLTRVLQICETGQRILKATKHDSSNGQDGSPTRGSTLTSGRCAQGLEISKSA